MKFEKKSMVDWYDPKQLAATGVKTVVSTVFGNFADRREMQAALDMGKPYYDFSKKEDLWLDYISDLGDGFNPTFTLASLLAKDHLLLDGEVAKRGNILVMGGDEVYPTPEAEEYRNRFQGPYHAAFPKDGGDENPPSLFVIPGNHDWYDGLTNFLKIFCQGRSLGNWRTEQTRSYFAIKLPHRYWLLGLDIQLSSDIDVPQLKYFQNVASSPDMLPGDKIILATAEPAWVYESFDEKNNSNKRLKFFVDRIVRGEREDPNDPECFYRGKNKDVEITTIVTGDLHHYSRYLETLPDGRKRHLITAGGGGAFMHTTHSLKSEIKKSEGFDASFQAAFPNKSESLTENFKNLLFFWNAPWMVLILGAVHALMFYFLQVGPEGTLLLDRDSGFVFGSYLDVLGVTVVTPMVLIFHVLLIFGIWKFSDVKSGNFKKTNSVVGGLHGLGHAWIFNFLVLYLPRWNDSLFRLEKLPAYLFFLEMLVIGGLLSGFLFGIYLWFCSRFLGNHSTEASSSFKGEDFKNFVRFHISDQGLTIYPVGIRKVVKNWKNVGTEETPRFKGDDISYELIEKPIFIPHHEKVI